MVDGCCYFDSKPFREFLILYAEILDSLLLLDFLEEHGKSVSFYDISTESVCFQQILLVSWCVVLLLHIHIKLRSTFPRNFIEPLLLLDPLLIHCFSSSNIFDICISRLNGRRCQELLYCSSLGNLRIC